MSEHTPTPWRKFDVNGVIAIQSPKDFDVVHWSGFDGSQFGDRENRANAEFIVKAVNSHEALVKALTDLLDACESIGTFSNGVIHNGIDEGNVYVAGLIDQARDALTCVGIAGDTP